MPMTPSELPNVTEEGSATRVAIVSEPEASVLADSLVSLLADSNEFTFSRFKYHTESGFKPSRAGFINPDIVVATLAAFDATNTRLFLASLQRAFPDCSVLVTTTSPDTFDFFG